MTIAVDLGRKATKQTNKQNYYRNLVRETNLANVAVLFEKIFPLDSRKFDFPIQIATLSIMCFKGSKVDFPYKCILWSLNIAILSKQIVQTLMKCSKLPNYPFSVF